MNQDITALWQIILTAVATLLGGIILLITSEFIKLLVVEPLKKYRDHVELIVDRLDFHSNFITNYFSEKPTSAEKEVMRQIRSDFRMAATQLNAVYASIYGKKIFRLLRLIPSKKELRDAFGNLMLLSNNLPERSRAEGGRDQIDTNIEAIMSVKIALRRH